MSAKVWVLLLLSVSFIGVSIGLRQWISNVGGPGTCIIANCSEPSVACMAEKQCRSAVMCNSKCQSQRNQEACNLLCELNYGYNSTRYRTLMQCMSDHGCLPVSPSDGKCLANDTNTIKNLTDMSQMKGKWWILRGINCGQTGWPAGFDAFPCQRDKFVLDSSGHWKDYIAYCGGSNNTCSTPMLFTVANVSMTSPGVMTHWYIDPPLRPQIEKWRALSWPHPDWMMYIYCGETPTGPYAGGSVVSRSSKPSLDSMPAYVLKEFISTAKKYGFDYYEMCVSDVSNCSN